MSFRFLGGRRKAYEEAIIVSGYYTLKEVARGYLPTFEACNVRWRTFVV